MGEIKIFENAEFGKVRVVTNNDEPWLVAYDVAATLGYQNGSRDVNRHVDQEDMSTASVILENGQSRNVTIINESGFYSLVLSSKMPEAKKFRRWVTSEVLPAIRKDGAYVATNGDETEEELMARALVAAKAAIQRKEERIKALAEQNSKQAQLIEQQKPAVNFTNAVSNSDTLILIHDMAKILKQHGYNTGGLRFFETLRRDGYLTLGNAPTQRSMELGIMRVVENTVTTPTNTKIVKTTKITGKGQVYFLNKYCKMSMVEAQNLISWENGMDQD